jgi:formamidopyrimidine-DNA glycosylase
VPELPEIETIKRGIKPLILNQVIQKIKVYNHKLRWIIPENISQSLQNKIIRSVKRRGKYLLLTTNNNALVIHLGMSGSLQLLPYPHPLKKHDHVDIILNNATCLCFNDPRRFGSLLLHDTPIAQKLLGNLGIEPLESTFTGQYLYEHSRNKKSAIKLFIMNNHIVTGIGNIYANEALFSAGINPLKSANKITLQEYELLTKSVKKILRTAIKSKGTTFRNFITHDGHSGTFKTLLKTYGRSGQSCVICKNKLESIRIGQRSTVYCPQCQK